MRWLKMAWRLLRYSVSDVKMNEAFEEAMLQAIRGENPSDTLRVWRNVKAVVLGGSVDVEASVNLEACESLGVPVVRSSSSLKTVYQDEGTLNLTYLVDQRRLFPGLESLIEVYRTLYSPISNILAKLGLNVKLDENAQGMYIGDGRVSEAGASFYYDWILFRISLNVETNLSEAARVLKKASSATTLAKELNKEVDVAEVEEALIEGVAAQLGVELQPGDVTSIERELAEKLYEVKYSRESWNLHMKAPLTLKDVLVDVYVAYPPTRSCLNLIRNVKSALNGLMDRVEFRVWMRGKGLDGRGVPPGVVMPGGLVRASKESIIPAVIINGEISFSRDVPSTEELRMKVLQAMGS
jgi:lipoate-protein ligase A